MLLHTKTPEYVNWAVRMDRATKRITHVSAGPILRNQDFRNEVGVNLKPRIPGLSCTPYQNFTMLRPSWRAVMRCRTDLSIRQLLGLHL